MRSIRLALYLMVGLVLGGASVMAFAQAAPIDYFFDPLGRPAATATGSMGTTAGQVRSALTMSRNDAGLVGTVTRTVKTSGAANAASFAVQAGGTIGRIPLASLVKTNLMAGVIIAGAGIVLDVLSDMNDPELTYVGGKGFGRMVRSYYVSGLHPGSRYASFTTAKDAAVGKWCHDGGNPAGCGEKQVVQVTEGQWKIQVRWQPPGYGEFTAWIDPGVVAVTLSQPEFAPAPEAETAAGARADALAGSDPVKAFDLLPDEASVTLEPAEVTGPATASDGSTIGYGGGRVTVNPKAGTDPEGGGDPDGGDTGTPTPEDKPDYAFTDSAFPSVPTLYTPKYPDGIKGVYDGRMAELKAAPLFGLIADLTGGAPSSGSCPSWSFNLSGLKLGTFSLQPPCEVWPFVRWVVIFLALMQARRIVFGG